MDIYCLDVGCDNVGGYFSSEQIDMLSIVQCNTYEDLVAFVCQCRQLEGVFSFEDMKKFVLQDLEKVKRHVFKMYQDTFVAHDSERVIVLENMLKRLNIKAEDIDVIKRAYGVRNKDSLDYIRDFVKNRYPNNYDDIFGFVHQFVSIERDQNKNVNLYDEFVFLNDNLLFFRTLLIGSGKSEVVTRKIVDRGSKDIFDYYFAKRDLDFAYRNNKSVRFHSLLTKGANEYLFKEMRKTEILEVLRNYVKTTIDFINEYNATHKLMDGSAVIKAVDLFNEIVSFDKNEQGEYENIWETQYGISIRDIVQVFEYAKEHKPKGVSYLYNEPFLEDEMRRKKVIEVLLQINDVSDGLIDTLGSQMHITFGTRDEAIEQCFRDFKYIQETKGFNIQITKFDLSLSERETLRTIGDNPEFSYDKVYEMKRMRLEDIAKIINNSGVLLTGVSYWSLTDSIDCNLERVRSNLLRKGIVSDISQVPTVCGGLMPVSQKYWKIISDSYQEERNEHKI